MKSPRSLKLCLPPAALGLALFLLPRNDGLAFSVFGNGEELSLAQRDFRIFNNFTDAAANDNVDPDPNFPGPPEYRGAVLAIWKACVEWGSGPHGTGGGDPSQPVLGSGGANFDPSFQGLATGPGGPSDNIHSELDGSGAGALAFTELPIADGWRIRYFRFGIIFHDGPDQTPACNDCRDLQGVAAHEFGHALGLDHSNVPGATMTPGGANLNPFRSIEADDIAGLQFIYGARSPSKPQIDTYELAGGAVVVVGSNFSATGNEVWFTRAPQHAATGNGDPVKATGLVSSNGGTRITAPIPTEAGPGDILVKIACDQHGCLSNAFPFDPAQPPCPTPLVYGTGKTTSSGSVPMLSASGIAAPGGNLRLMLSGAISDVPAVLFYGRGPAQMPFLGGDLLAAPPIIRERMFMTVFGAADLPIRVDPTMAGHVRNYQVWFLDPGDPFGAGLSNAVQVTFCP